MEIIPTTEKTLRRTKLRARLAKRQVIRMRDRYMQGRRGPWFADGDLNMDWVRWEWAISIHESLTSLIALQVQCLRARAGKEGS